MKTLSLYLFILIALTPALFSQEIPNGDGDLLWERSLIVDGISRTVNDAKFHPINGNIIAAVNHEIWEIDPKDGHTIRVFEGPSKIDKDKSIVEIDISPDGNLIITNGLERYSGLYFWDYNEGKFIDSLNYYSWRGRFYPDNQRMMFFAKPTPGGLSSGFVQYDYKTKKVIFEKMMNEGFVHKTATLSKDGKYLALGLFNTYSEKFSMELWDAETLTKIKSFGSPGDINEFSDVQISDDNQYVGYTTRGGETKLFLIDIDKGETIKTFKDVYAFTFFSVRNRIIIYNSLGIDKSNRQILALPNLNILYQFQEGGVLIRTNKLNEVFSVGFDTTLGVKMQYFSNKWFEVGMKNTQETESILYPNPTTDYLTVRNTLACSLQEIEIYNIFGVCVLTVETQNFVSLQKIDVSSLPPGVYIVRVGNEKPMKFSVVR
jgi:hypothetical protein